MKSKSVDYKSKKGLETVDENELVQLLDNPDSTDVIDDEVIEHIKGFAVEQYEKLVTTGSKIDENRAMKIRATYGQIIGIMDNLQKKTKVE